MTRQPKTATLFLVCQHYHSGQSSRGYRLMCALQRRMERFGYTNRHHVMSTSTDRLYKQMVKAYADKL